MATRYYAINVTTPTSTMPSSPLVTVWKMEDVILSRIEIDVPPGHNALTGIAIFRSQQQVIPWGNSGFLIANDRLLVIDVNEELTESELVIHTYNQDIFQHTHYLRATVSDIQAAGTSSALPAPIIPSAILVSG